MCLSCRRLWTAVQALWSTLYVTSGGALLTAGIFFAISLPDHLHLYGTLCAGAWNIIMGIAGGMVACMSEFSPRRQETLLYMAVSILVVNCINLTLIEYWFYVVDMPKLLGHYSNHLLIEYACFVTRIASAVVLVVAFLDSQFSFCSMQSTPKPQGAKKLRGSHEQVSDIEYIIPRPKNSKPSPQAPYDAYAQSWVFDAENNASCSNSKDHGGYFRVVQNGTPKKPSSGGGRSTRGMQNGIVKETSHLIDNPVVQIEEASDDSNSGRSDRKLCYMKSFSRSQSPVALSSPSSSQISLDAPPPLEATASATVVVSPPAIYQCLEKLTEPTIYRTRLNTALSSKEEDYYQAPQAIVMRKVEAASPRVEKVQYASLMKELQKAIISKKDPPSVTSPQSNASDSDKTHTTSKSSSRSEGQKSSDADFSKELEAALQLIQDLESPNTVETPSEAAKSPLAPSGGVALAVWRGSDVSESSDKTLSAVGSLAEMTSPMSDGQPAGMTDLLKAHQQSEVKGIVPAVPAGWPPWNRGSIPVHYPDSQSTSGYSSPTQGPTPNWSTTSSVSGSNPELKPTSYSIRNTDSSTVISLFSSTPVPAKSRSVTLVKITSDEPRQTLSTFRPPPVSQPQSNWKLNSLLRKKKHVGLPPELESAIIKSESLAYLTDLELLARHQRNQEMQREIEKKVVQQLGVPRAARTESNC